jgi:hypothetical protein
MPPPHHPLCEFWFEQYPWECTCGVTGRKRFETMTAEASESAISTLTQENGNGRKDG